MAEEAPGSTSPLKRDGEMMTRREWDLAERVSELESQVGEQLELSTIREIEIRSLRHELDLRMAYNAHLEELAAERNSFLGHLVAERDAAIDRIVAERTAALELIANERLQEVQRLSQDLEGMRVPIDGMTDAEVRATLIAERQRISYRVVQRLTRNRGMFKVTRRFFRLLAPRS